MSATRRVAAVLVDGERLTVRVEEVDGTQTEFSVPYGQHADYGSYASPATFGLALHDLASALRCFQPSLAPRGTSMIAPAHSPVSVRR